MFLEMNVVNGIFYKAERFQPKYHWAEIKYPVAVQNRSWQLFCQRDVFSQYTSTFASAIAACRRKLVRLIM